MYTKNVPLHAGMYLCLKGSDDDDDYRFDILLHVQLLLPLPPTYLSTYPPSSFFSMAWLGLACLLLCK